MSILKSTNTGRCSIRLDDVYLLNNGWYYKNLPNGDIDKSHIYKDEQHFLTIIGLQLMVGDFTMISYHEEDEMYNYDIFLYSLHDLDNIEKYWKDKEINFTEAEKELLEKYPGCKSLNLVYKQLPVFNCNSFDIEKPDLNEYIKFNK